MGVSRIIVQPSDGRVDLLTEEPGRPADHYLTVNCAEVDEWITKMREEFPRAEVTDYRKKD